VHIAAVSDCEVYELLHINQRIPFSKQSDHSKARSYSHFDAKTTALLNKS